MFHLTCSARIQYSRVPAFLLAAAAAAPDFAEPFALDTFGGTGTPDASFGRFAGLSIESL